MSSQKLTGKKTGDCPDWVLKSGDVVPDPITVGTIVMSALGAAGEAVVRGTVGEAAKDAYQALKARVTQLVGRNAADLASTTYTGISEPEVATAIDCLPRVEQEFLHDLVRALVRELREHTSPVGLDAKKFEALEVQLGNITVTKGVGARFIDGSVKGTFKTGDISVGDPLGKS